MVKLACDYCLKKGGALYAMAGEWQDRQVTVSKTVGVCVCFQIDVHFFSLTVRKSAHTSKLERQPYSPPAAPHLLPSLLTHTVYCR